MTLTKATYSMIEGAPTNVLDFIPGNLHAAILNYTSTDDVSTYIADAYAANAVVYFPAGRYYAASTIDLSGIYGAGMIGEGSNTSDTRTEIVINATDTQGISFWGPVRIENVYLRYAAQQTTAHTNSILLALNNITTAYVNNVRLRYGHINLGIPQVAFGATTYNVIFSSLFDGVYSYEASHTHIDLRCFSGGGTNTRFDNLYINGGGSLDFATPGQSCLYAIRGTNWSGYEFGAVSVDGQIFTERMIETNQCFALFESLRFEADTTKKDNDGWIYATGSESAVQFGYVEFKNCRALLADAPTANYLFRDATTVAILDVSTLRVTTDCNFTSPVMRVITTSTASEESRIRFYSILNSAAGLNTEAYTGGAGIDPSPIKLWDGRNLSVMWKSGATTLSYDWRYGSAAPAAGTWAAGDIVWNTAPTAGINSGWVCTVAGTPGTWSPFGQAGVMTSILSTPSYVGQLAVVAGVGYMATGTASSADWKQIT